MDETKHPKSIEEKIQIRNNWLKIFIWTFFSIIVGLKLITAPTNFDFSDFDFSSLLSLLLAIFAIGLSVAFYFKSTETSNRFYDNTYKFTKDISEILGRIDSGFGERLRHLDEGYTSLRDNFYSNGSNEQDKEDEIKKAESKIDTDKKKLELEVAERKKIIEELMKKANIGDQEKEAINSKLEEREKEIANLNRELRHLKRQVYRAEKSINEMATKIPESLKSYLLDKFYPILEGDFLFEAPTTIIHSRLTDKLNDLPYQAIIDFADFNIVDKKRRKFTSFGIDLLKSLSRSI